MDEPWQSSANRYYAFGGEKLDLLDRISKTPPPSTSRSRSPPSTTRNRKSAPTSPAFRLPALPKSSLLDRISPKGYSPQSISAASLRPLSPELGDYLDAQMDEEEEEQVIRVLDNNRELVYQRDFGSDDRQDREGELHESRNSSPVKKRKLVHPNQPTNKSTPQTSPTQTKPIQKSRHTRSRSPSPPRPRSNTTSPARKEPLGSRLGIDWCSGSTTGTGSTFGKQSGLSFGFAGYEYNTSAEVNTTGKATLLDRIQATPTPEPPHDDPHDSTCGFLSFEDRIDTDKPSPPSVVTQDHSDQAREPSVEEGKISGGTSLLHRIGSFRPISHPELEGPREGGEQRNPDHEADHEEEEAIGDDALIPLTVPPPVPPPRSQDLRMDSLPPPRESTPKIPNRENLPECAVQLGSVASSRSATSPSEPGTPPQAKEVASEGIKSMEEHAEDLLQDIQKEFLSKNVSPSSTELGGIIPGLPVEGDASVSPNYLGDPFRTSPSPILDGMPPLVRARSISLLLDVDHRDATPVAMSTYTHTPRSNTGSIPGSISQSTSLLTDDPNKDVLLEVDPEVDQITKQALADLIVHSLKLNHDFGANEGWENSDVVRRAIKQEVDEHARDFLRLAAQLAKRMDSMREPSESTEVPDVEPDRPIVEPILPDVAENGHLEAPPLVGIAEDNEELPPCEGATEHVSDAEMDSVSPEVLQSDPGEDGAQPNDEPTGEQEPDNDDVENVDQVDHQEHLDEGAPNEAGQEIPGVWYARTGEVRTDTIREQIEVSEAVAARVKKWVKGNFGSIK